MARKETSTIEIIIKGQKANATIREMRSSVKILNAEMSRLPTNSKAFADKSAELKVVNKRLKTINDDVRGVGNAFTSIKNEIKKFSLITAAALAIGFLVNKVGDLVNQNARLSDSYADIRKTTNMTMAEVQKLDKAFGQMDTRTARKELRAIAVAAGQLGLAKGDILSFTAATDKLAVALSDEFKGGAEEVSKTMGKLRNVLSDMKTGDIAKDMLHIGNAVNALGASGIATGPIVTDFARRIGGVGISLGLTSGQVLGLSATLEELNVRVERGGTAVNRILLKMTQDIEAFANIAGEDVDVFTDMVNTDLFGAFVKVAEGAANSSDSATAFGKVLDDLGVDGAGASEVFSKLGRNGKLLAEKVDLATASLTNTDSIMAEFNIKNQNLAADLAKVGKAINSAFVNSAVMDGLKGMVGWLAKLVKKTHGLSDTLRDEATDLRLTAIKIDSLNIGNKERIRLINELKETYPEYLSNLDAETASNELVKKSIDGVLDSMVNRIILQRKAEDITNKASDAADEKENLLEKETHLLNALDKAYAANIESQKKAGWEHLENLKATVAGMTVEEKAVFILENKEKVLERTRTGIKNHSTEVGNVSKALYSYKIALEDSNEAEAELLVLKDEAIELEKRLAGTVSGKMDAEIAQRAGIKRLHAAWDEEKAKEMLTKLAKDKADAKIIADEEIEAEEKLKEELIKTTKDLNEKIAALNIEASNRQLADNEKELALVDQNYVKLLLRAKGNSTQTKELERLHIAEIEDLKQKHADKARQDKDALQNDIYLATLSANDKEVVLEMQRWEQLIATALAGGEDVTALRQEMADAINEIVVAQKEKEGETIATADEKEINGLTKLQREKLEKFRKYAASSMTVINSLSTIQKNKDDAELNGHRKKLKDKLAANDKALADEGFDKKQHAANVLKIQADHDAKEDALRKVAHQREQRIKLAQIGMNLAMELSSISAAAAANPTNAVTFGVAGALQYGLQSGIAIARAAIQTVAVSTSKYAGGGFNSSDNPQGFTSGETYYTNSASGVDFIAGEAGREWISPNWMLEDPKTAPIIEHLESVRQNRGFAGGGSNAVAVDETEATESGNATSNAELTAAINRLNTVLNGGIMARLDYELNLKDVAKIEEAKDFARVA